MAEDYHVDLSGRLHGKKKIGVACVGATTKTNNGCVISSDLKEFIQKELFAGKKKSDCAKLYAIIIYNLIVSKLDDIKTLIICNDADFTYTKHYLEILLSKHTYNFQIISITKFKGILGRKVNSLADNFAGHYRKRGLKKNRWNKGRPLNVVTINYLLVKSQWAMIEKDKE